MKYKVGDSFEIIDGISCGCIVKIDMLTKSRYAPYHSYDRGMSFSEEYLDEYCELIENEEETISDKSNKDNALSTQVGGSHYKNFTIQPIEFTHKNNLNFCQGNVIKYISRYNNKNGLEDLKKVIHYVQLLAQLEYGEEI